MNQITISLALVVVAALMTVPMIRCLSNKRAAIRSMAIVSLVVDVLWLIGALLVLWSSSLAIILGLTQMTLSLFATAFAAVVALPLVAAKSGLGNAAKISVYTTLSLIAITYLGALGLIWSGGVFLLLITGPLALVSLILTTGLITAKRK